MYQEEFPASHTDQRDLGWTSTFGKRHYVTDVRIDYALPSLNIATKSLLTSSEEDTECSKKGWISFLSLQSSGSELPILDGLQCNL